MSDWNGSIIMDEFVKIAAEAGLISTNLQPKDKDFVGNPNTPTPVITRNDPTEEYKSKDTKIMEKAHPETMKTLDAMGDGGVVENEMEQQEKDLEIATKMPTGALIGVHAELINSLIKIADSLDVAGKEKIAARIDETISSLSKLPFYCNQLQKKAWLGSAIGLISWVVPTLFDWFRAKKTPLAGKPMGPVGRGLFGGTAIIMSGIQLLHYFGEKLTSIQEGIRPDTADLYAVLEKASEESAEAAEAKKLLTPFANACSNLTLTKKEDFARFIKELKKVETIVPELKRLIYAYEKITSPSYLGISLSRRVGEKFNDFLTSLEETKKDMEQIAAVGNKAESIAQQDLEEARAMPIEKSEGNVAALQNILFTRGFPRGNPWPGEVTGKLDENTIRAAKELETKLDSSLSDFAKSKGLSGTFRGQIIDNNQIVIDPRRLLKILSLTEKQV